MTNPVQTQADGVGPYYHRRYELEFIAKGRTPEALMTELQSDLNRYSAQILARFEKTVGDPHVLRPGDEYMIHITGPWNGPVRVKDVTKTSFRLMTLEGHMEAGEIEFSVASTDTGRIRFRIESWARSRNRLVDLVYDKLPFARLAQTEMWDEYCRAFALKGMTEEQNLDVRILTERRDSESGEWQRVD